MRQVDRRSSMPFHFHAQRQPGYQPVVQPGDGGLNRLEVGLLTLEEGAAYTAATEGQETFLVLWEGQGMVEVGDRRWAVARAGLFQEKPSAVYVPPGMAWTIQGEPELEVVVCRAATGFAGAPRYIGPEEIGVREVGRAPYRRIIYPIATDDFPAGQLLIGETFHLPGEWSSYPPHKHDTWDPPHEIQLEEVYFYRIHPPQGFGLQRLYTAEGDIDEVLLLRDYDLVTIPRGYHPLVAAPGYVIYYLWVLAGDERRMQVRNDPAHTWVEERPVWGQ
ncbi:MAG TPA: 5-deoxy-glucuronate isomerase [Chloroflexi bacterium]|nr:5-deoxy-glucuronate isomerase [Chloroflexota bacterium]